MRDIAGQAAVSLGAAYYYFPSKEASVLRYYEQLLDEYSVNLLVPLVPLLSLPPARMIRERIQKMLVDAGLTPARPPEAS